MLCVNFMSRLAKKPILIPEKVELSKDNGHILARGPLGEVKRYFIEGGTGVKIDIKGKEIYLSSLKNAKKSQALLGTYLSHLKNMIKGVTEGFQKRLIIEGIGYRAQIDGGNLVLNLGLSHPVIKKIPQGLKVQVEKNIISVFGCDKDLVGQFSAEVRALKKPEPYKGKGIRYENEIIRRKAGKKAATAG